MLNCPPLYLDTNNQPSSPVLTVIKLINHRLISQCCIVRCLSDVCVITMVHVGTLSHKVGLLRTEDWRCCCDVVVVVLV